MFIRWSPMYFIWKAKAILDDIVPHGEIIVTVCEILYQLIIVVGVCGNFLLLVGLTRLQPRGSSYVYLSWLTLTDLLFLLVSSLAYVFDYAGVNLSSNYPVLFIVCRLTDTLKRALFAAGAFVLILLTIQRYWAVRHLNEGGYDDDGGRTLPGANGLTAFLVAIIFHVPDVFLNEIEEGVAYPKISTDTKFIDDPYANDDVYSCMRTSLQDQSDFEVYILIRDIITKIIPVVIVTTLTIHIVWIFVQASCRQCEEGRPPSPSRSGCSSTMEERHLLHVLLGIAIKFLICTIPQIVGADQAAVNYLLAISSTSTFCLCCLCSAEIRSTLHGTLCRTSFPADSNESDFDLQSHQHVPTF